MNRTMNLSALECNQLFQEYMNLYRPLVVALPYKELLVNESRGTLKGLSVALDEVQTAFYNFNDTFEKICFGSNQQEPPKRKAKKVKPIMITM